MVGDDHSDFDKPYLVSALIEPFLMLTTVAENLMTIMLLPHLRLVYLTMTRCQGELNNVEKLESIPLRLRFDATKSIRESLPPAQSCERRMSNLMVFFQLEISMKLDA